MEQRLILTKEKDADGLYVYKDSLKGMQFLHVFLDGISSNC